MCFLRKLFPLAFCLLPVLSQAEEVNYTAEFDHESVSIKEFNSVNRRLVTLRVKADKGIFFPLEGCYATVRCKGKHFNAHVVFSLWDELSQSTLIELEIDNDWQGEEESQISIPLLYSEDGIEHISLTIDPDAKDKIIDGTLIRYSVEKAADSGELDRVTLKSTYDNHLIAIALLDKKGKESSAGGTYSASRSLFSSTGEKVYSRSIQRNSIVETLKLTLISSETEKREIKLSIPVQTIGLTPSLPRTEEQDYVPSMTLWAKGYALNLHTVSSIFEKVYVLRFTTPSIGSTFISEYESFNFHSSSFYANKQTWSQQTNHQYLYCTQGQERNKDAYSILKIKGHYSKKPYQLLSGACSDKGGLIIIGGVDYALYTVEVKRGILFGADYKYTFTFFSPKCTNYSFYNEKGEPVEIKSTVSSSTISNQGFTVHETKITSTEKIAELRNFYLPRPHKEFQISYPLK